MFGIGTGELLLILVIAMVVFGPERMVELAGEMGRMVAKLRQETDEVTREFKGAFDPEASDEEASAKPEAQSESATPQEAEEAAAAEAAADEGQQESASVSLEETALAEEEQVEDAEPVDISVGEFVPRDEEVDATDLDLPVVMAGEEAEQEET